MWWLPSISVLLRICMKALDAAPTPANTSVCKTILCPYYATSGVLGGVTVCNPVAGRDFDEV